MPFHLEVLDAILDGQEHEQGQKEGLDDLPIDGDVAPFDHSREDAQLNDAKQHGHNAEGHGPHKDHVDLSAAMSGKRTHYDRCQTDDKGGKGGCPAVSPRGSLLFGLGRGLVGRPGLEPWLEFGIYRWTWPLHNNTEEVWKKHTPQDPSIPNTDNAGTG